MYKEKYRRNVDVKYPISHKNRRGATILENRTHFGPTRKWMKKYANKI